MPIRDSEKARYPRDWPQISAAIRERAGGRCEKCAAPNGERIARGQGKDAGTYMLADGGATHCAETGALLGYSRGSEYNAARVVKIVLTVAHLDHQPENCDPENLRAWCQRCHLRYDAKHHAGNAAKTRHGRKALADLFTPQSTPSDTPAPSAHPAGPDAPDQP